MVKSKVDACIFCGEVPCICNTKIKSPPVKKARPPAPRTDEPARARNSHLDAMRSAAASAPVRPPVPEARRPRMEVTLSDADIIWNAAIRNLAPLLCESDREQYAGIITSKPHPDEAKIMWKSRRQDVE